MCDKAVSTYPSTIKFVPNCFIKQLIDVILYLFLSNPDQYKTQEMYDRVVSEDPF